MYKEYSPDLILLNDIGKNYPKIVDYYVYCANPMKERHAGAAIAVKNRLKHQRIEGFDSDLVAVRVYTSHGPIVVATAYIPPRRNLDFGDFHRLFGLPDPIYLLGDLNAIHYTFGYAHCNNLGLQVNSFFERKELQHLGPHFKTRYTGKTATSPDIVLASKNAHLNTLCLEGPPTSSDHIPIIFKVSVNPLAIRIPRRRQYRKADWDKFREKLGEALPIEADSLSPTELDQATQTWIKNVQEAIDDAVPTIPVRTVPGVQPTPEILEIRRNLATLQQVSYCIGPSPDIMGAIRNYRALLASQYADLRIKVWEGIIDKISDSPDERTFFQSIKRMGGFSKKSVCRVRDAQNMPLVESADKAEVFLKYWERIFRNDQEDDHRFDQENLALVEDTVTQRRQELDPLQRSDLSLLNSAFPPYNVKLLKDDIKRLKPRAPGPSGITAHAMKNLPENALSDLAMIFNHALALGYFPQPFKQAEMVFIPKGKGSHYKVENHRGISLLEIPGKLLERELNFRFTKEIRDNDLNHKDQHGFLANRGCHTALSVVNEELARAEELKQICAVVLRDLSLAFDMVWHNGIQYKLLLAPLNPLLRKCLTSYITNRTAYVKIEGHKSRPFRLNSGVPQGGCLSPTMFIFYTSDLPSAGVATSCVRSTDVVFADDVSQILVRPKPRLNPGLNYLSYDIRSEVKRINDYEKKWKLKTNLNKFNIVLNTRLRKQKNEIMIDGEILKLQTTGKCLGLAFGTHGLAKHATEKANVANVRLTKLLRFKQLSLERKRQLYLTLVRSAMLYPSVPMNTLCNTSMHKLQVVQNKAIDRFIAPKGDAHRRAAIGHDMARLDPINVVLHNQAAKTWATMRNFHNEKYQHLIFPLANSGKRRLYSCSHMLAEGPAPNPIFVRWGVAERTGVG